MSVGEVFDKMTILIIKMERITDPIKTLNVSKEYHALYDVAHHMIQGELKILFDELYRINVALWDIEDGIRLKESRKEFDQEFIQLARSVYQTNDKRFEIKSKINTTCKSNMVEEKQHVSY